MNMFDADKTIMIDNMLSRFHLIPGRVGQLDRQTDRQTDGRTTGQNCYINIARQCADAR